MTIRLSLLLERNRDDDAVVGAEILRQVSLSGRVFDERESARADGG